ncbi:hypothetical protein C7S10_19360 [Nocardioides currus]|uniref:Uncharacterized protein n=1 Tax=Nocardioides currus TaxID=2133958 RepID=A0A2R7YTA0_9ACTN|nr:hypothetical protein C7S10_19360 [Nocardioides currus]
MPSALTFASHSGQDCPTTPGRYGRCQNFVQGLQSRPQAVRVCPSPLAWLVRVGTRWAWPPSYAQVQPREVMYH